MEEGRRFARSFRDLEVYQTGLTLVVDVHEFCKTMPAEERYSLCDQMRRASRSVCANISEAWRKRRYVAAFAAKLSDAETEASEMQAWLDVSLKLRYMTAETHNEYDKRYESLVSQIVTMIDNAEQWCWRKK